MRSIIQISVLFFLVAAFSCYTDSDLQGQWNTITANGTCYPSSIQIHQLPEVSLQSFTIIMEFPNSDACSNASFPLYFLDYMQIYYCWQEVEQSICNLQDEFYGPANTTMFFGQWYPSNGYFLLNFYMEKAGENGTYYPQWGINTTRGDYLY